MMPLKCSNIRIQMPPLCPPLPCPSISPNHPPHLLATPSTSTSYNPEMCVIVSDQNRVVGAESRSVTVKNRLLGRGVYLVVLDPLRDAILMQKRSAKKDCYPGMLDVVTAGVVRAGDSYADTAKRELEEELGWSAALVGPQSFLSDDVTDVEEQAAIATRQPPVSPSLGASNQITLERLFVFPYQDATCHVWGCAFVVRVPPNTPPPVLQAEEVDWVKWIQLRDLMDEKKDEWKAMTPVGKHVLQSYLQRFRPDLISKL